MTASTIPSNPAGFRNVVDTLRPRTFRYLFRLCRNRHDAEDLLQETLVRVWTRRHQFRGDGRLSRFVRRVAYTTFLNSRRQRTHPSRNWTLPLVSADSNADPGIACARRDNRKQLAVRLDALVAELPETLREAFVRFQMRGVPAQEIALSLGITAKAVFHRVHRARAILRARLAPSERCP